MKTSENTAELVKALVKARAEFPAIKRDKVAKVPTKNGGSFQYTYADLSSVVDATEPVLLKHGIILTHGMISNGHTALTCRLSHTSGEWMQAEYPLPDSCTPQELGSAITYGRRYTSCAMLGIVTEDDDDGATATHRKPEAESVPRHVTDQTPPPADDAEPSQPMEAGPAMERIKVKRVTKKSGQGAQGPWTKFGILAEFGGGRADEWLNTFDTKKGALAEKNQGKYVVASYSPGKPFNGKPTLNLDEITEIENQTA